MVLVTFVTFCAIACAVLFGLAWQRHRISEQRLRYDGTWGLPANTYTLERSNAPSAKARQDAFRAQIRLNVTVRALQVVAVVVLSILLVVSWMWFDPKQ